MIAGIIGNRLERLAGRGEHHGGAGNNRHAAHNVARSAGGGIKFAQLVSGHAVDLFRKNAPERCMVPA